MSQKKVLQSRHIKFENPEPAIPSFSVTREGEQVPARHPCRPEVSHADIALLTPLPTLVPAAVRPGPFHAVHRAAVVRF